MRDPKRIPVILSEIQKMWETVPDLRLGQFMKNLESQGLVEDLYFLEDAKLISYLKLLYSVNEDTGARKDQS